MHGELIDELTRFALKYNLIFTCEFNEKFREYSFRFQDRQRTWGYCRVITEEQLDNAAFSTVYFAHGIIANLKSQIEKYGVNQHEPERLYFPSSTER